MRDLLLILGGLALGAVLAITTALLIGRAALRASPHASGGDDKMRAEESALAVLNPGDPARRRSISHAPRRR